MLPTRRQKHKQAVFDEIKATARELLQTQGTAGLSLRAIARDMGMTSAALYYYYPSVGDLITTLIVDAFTALTTRLTEVVQAENGAFSERALRLALAYREWALEHPVDFQLIYGNPIPGYQQPTEITYPPARQGFALLAGLIAEAIEAEALVPTEAYRKLPPELDAPLATLQHIEKHDVSPTALYMAASVWARMHGLVMLELFNLIQPVIGDTEAFYLNETHIMLEQLGLRED